MQSVLIHAVTSADASPKVDQDFGFLGSVLNANITEQLVMLLLLGLSVVSWAVIYQKWRALKRAQVQSEAFLDGFWNAKRLDAFYEGASQYPASPVAHVFRAGYLELSKLRQKQSDNSELNMEVLQSVERSMRRSASQQLTTMESMMSFLATTGSTSPFVGLFGTVIGIMGAFQDIGRMGNADLATVAPGIGGALVATAFGLLAAIPAVMAYNYFIARIHVLDMEIQNFSSDFLNIIKRHFL